MSIAILNNMNNIRIINNDTVTKILKFPEAIVFVISATNPLEAIPFASASPPPKSNKIPYANFSVSFH